MSGGPPTIVIVNYGMGNLRSVSNAFRALGCNPFITRHPMDLSEGDGVVLPGVGAFGDGIANLRADGWIEPLNRYVLEERKPFLGICLGMQLLATTGLEHGRHEGLNWVAGVARRLEPDGETIRIPHIGWNDVRVCRKGALFDGVVENPSFYFVHSYVLAPDDESVVTAVCDHGEEFVASIEWQNIHATQFHPEKSQHAGLAVLRNFVRLTTSDA